MNNIFDSFPVIKLASGVVLRKIALEADHLDFFNYITNPQVTNYLAADDIPHSPEGAKIELGYWEKMYDRQVSVYWAVALESNNQIIGTAGFNYWNKGQRRAEISYDLDYNHWGKGISTNAVKAITNFGLKDMQVQRIQATVAVDNIPSIRVLEKSGYKREGMMEKYGILNGQAKDFYLYSKL